MPNLTQLRLAAREIFEEALQAVDAGDAVRQAVSLDGSLLRIRETAIDISQRRVYSIAVGKAAFKMAVALEGSLGESPAGGVLSGQIPDASALRTDWQTFLGGHPEPNEQSLAAAHAAFDLLEQANAERALVVFSASGGGSAMIEYPISEDITLADLRGANRALVNSGAPISEINAVRRSFSAVKGGRLAARAPRCDRITLIISDVPPGEDRNVASGPTLAPAADAPQAAEVVARHNLRSQLPESILRAIDSQVSEPAEHGSTLLRKHFVLLDNDTALEAAARAARQAGFVTEIVRDISDQSSAEGCAELISRLEGMRRKANASEPVCLVSGGEFACPVKGDGIGGRNLETALRLACSVNSSDDPPFVALCAGTDGIDGNSPAAGAIVDSSTAKRAASIGLDPDDFLQRSDAYSFFVALGDAITTGPTGTNVRDLRILMG